MALARQSSPFAAIINAILSRISSILAIDPAFVTLVTTDEYVLTELEPVNVRVQVFPPRPVNPHDGGDLVNQGAGRLALDVARFVRVYLHSRSGVDVSESDNAGLMGGHPNAVVTDTPDALTGHFWYEEAVLNSLHHFFPTLSGSFVMIGPIRWSSDNDAPSRKVEDGDGVITSMLDFDLTYCGSITIADPAA